MARSTSGGSKTVIYAALAGNLAIAVTKLAASFYTGSSAMLTEAIHSFVDTGNQGLLLYGLRRAARPADERHPFGHGLEVYFWSFVVALMIFALGGAFSIYEGLHKIVRPEPIESAWVNYAVLAASAVFEGLSFRVAWREFQTYHADVPLWAGIRRSKDPSLFAVLLEDGAALVGLAIAALGVTGTTLLGSGVADGIASVAIGCLLVFTAVVLANETRSLLTGESASPRLLRAARAVLQADPRVLSIDEMLSLHLGPREVLIAVTLALRPDLTVDEVRRTAQELRDRIEEGEPIVSHVFFRLDSHRVDPPARAP
jgi:cation diffusion facilitator family transporter